MSWLWRWSSLLGRFSSPCDERAGTTKERSPTTPRACQYTKCSDLNGDLHIIGLVRPSADGTVGSSSDVRVLQFIRVLRSRVFPESSDLTRYCVKHSPPEGKNVLCEARGH